LEQGFPTPRSQGAAATFGEAIYIVYGTVLETSLFLPDSSTQWPSSPVPNPFPSPVSIRPSYAVVNTKLYVMGGEIGGPAVSRVLSFDPSASIDPPEQWQILTSNPNPRRSACSASLNGKIYLFGGFNDDTSILSIDVFDTEANNGLGSWESLGIEIPFPFLNCAAVQAESSIFVVGGYDGNDVLRNIFRFGPDDNQMLSFEPLVAELSIGREKHTATLINGKIAIVGGEDIEGDVIDSVEMFDPVSNDVFSLPSLIVARGSHQAAAFSNVLYVFGGTDSGSNPLNSAEFLTFPSLSV